MKRHATVPGFSLSGSKAQKQMRSFCPVCRDMLVAATNSQHVTRNVVRHWWACESCGFEFDTMVRLPALPADLCQSIGSMMA